MCKHLDRSNGSKSWCESCCNKLAIRRHRLKHGEPHPYLEPDIHICDYCNKDYNKEKMATLRPRYGAKWYDKNTCWNCYFDNYIFGITKSKLRTQLGAALLNKIIKENPEFIEAEIALTKTRYILSGKINQQFNKSDYANTSKQL